jgi:hypothetical protein
MKKILILAIVSMFVFHCAASTDTAQSTTNTDTSTTRSAPTTQGNCVVGTDTVGNCKVN